MYTAKGQLDANAMLKQYSPLVRRLAHQMIAKLPANVEPAYDRMTLEIAGTTPN